MISNNIEEFNYLGVSDINNKGEGQKYCVLEPPSAHMTWCNDIINQIAPEAEVFQEFGYGIDNDDEFCNYVDRAFKWGARVFSSSYAYPMSEKKLAKLREVIGKGAFVFLSAGNDYKQISKDKIRYYLDEAFVISAYSYKNSDIYHEWYSAFGRQVDIAGLAQLYVTSGELFEGTSCATPQQAAICLLYLNKIPDLTPQNYIETLSDNFIDLETGGKDDKSGWGILTYKESDDMIIKLQIDSKIAVVDGKEIELDTTPIIHNDRTLVPLRFIAEQLGCKVEWDSVTQEITIVKE